MFINIILSFHITQIKIHENIKLLPVIQLEKLSLSNHGGNFMCQVITKILKRLPFCDGLDGLLAIL